MYQIRRFLPVLAASATLLLILVPTPDGATTLDVVGAPPTGESWQRAERLYAEGSYALALREYERLPASSLSGSQARWLAFRIADCGWRSQAATQNADPTKLEAARESLQNMVRDAVRDEDRDRVWVEIQESLGDFWWNRRGAANWSSAWSHYRLALEWWAGSRDLEIARNRYLEIVRKAARPRWADRWYVYGNYGNQLPLDVLENANSIARTPGDVALTRYLMAMALRNQVSNAAQYDRAVAAFEDAVEDGRSNDWHDDALFHYAQFVMSPGRPVRVEGGGIGHRPDYVEAARLFRMFLREYDKGESRYHDTARSQLERIVAPSLSVMVSNVFLPDSEVRYHLAWRNVPEIRLALYAVDLPADVRLIPARGSREFLETIDLAGKSAIRTWTPETDGNRGDHVPGQSTMRLDEALEPGAYVLAAEGGDRAVRELVLVTRVAVVLKTGGGRALAYVANALDGSPVADAEVALWDGRRGARSRRVWRRTTARTDEDGIARFDVAGDDHLELFLAASDGQHQALSLGQAYRTSLRRADWRIYAFTDRPAYRPEETVQWKFIARQTGRDGYTVPPADALSFRIVDPRGVEIAEDKLELNALGSAWGSLEVGSDMALGAYRVEFRNSGNDTVGVATLFRLEEYKLPEFEVEVETAAEDGRPRNFRVGDTVEARIVARYYFGGPVAGATARIVVRQRPLHVWWGPERAYPWLYDDAGHGESWRHGGGSTVLTTDVVTDGDGRAAISFPTPAHSGQDFEYTVEARVTDASRREVAGSGTVRVTRQRYFAFARPKHTLFRPGQRVVVDLKTIGADRAPVEATGVVTVTRERWEEIWIDPYGRRVRGEALDHARRGGVFPPPPPRPGDPGWRLDFRGYRSKTVLTRPVKTGADGHAEFEFTPESEGYFRVAWSSEEDDLFPIRAETNVWVTTRETTDLGYRSDGVRIIVDRDSFRVGETAPVMITAPNPGAYVLFGLDAEGLDSYRLIRLDGTVKLLRLAVEVRHVPNVHLDAAMVLDTRLHTDVRDVVVPPENRFLAVEIDLGAETYLPGEEARAVVRTLDHDGRPVAAEVALGVVDRSVYAIQSELAPDPREFFFGDRRSMEMRTSSSFEMRPYVRLLPEPEGSGGVVPVPGDARGQVVGGVAYEGVDKDSLRESGAMAPGLAERKRIVVSKEAPAPTSVSDAGEQADVVVRTDFRSTAFWKPSIATGPRGEATVTIRYPESLTSWQAKARVVASGQRVGIAEASVRTTRPLIVRLQGPRFLVAGDVAVISAVVDNRTDGPLVVEPALVAEGVETEGRLVDGRVDPVAGPDLEIPAGGQARADWRIRATSAGTARFTVRASAGKHGDAMARTYPVHEHGIEKFVATSGKVRGDDVRVTVDLPAARRKGSTTFTVQVTPSLAVTMLDALPYLIDYPYGCTEQTMSRFLPAVLVARALEKVGVRPSDVEGRLFGGIETGHVDNTHPEGARGLGELDRMVRDGSERLADMQHGDGGWGWWKEGDSDPFMTAYVVWGLSEAKAAGIGVDRGRLDRAVQYLDHELVDHEDRADLQSWILHAVSVARNVRRQDPSKFQRAAFENVWNDRDRLNAYTRALLALSADLMGDSERAGILARNLANGVIRDDAPDRSVVVKGSRTGGQHVVGTAHWGRDGVAWRWSDGSVEATSFALRAFLAIDPGNELVEPVVQWLIRNRRGAQWSNTRDTAIAVMALTDYLEISGELVADLEYEVEVNGQRLASRQVASRDVLAAPSRFEVDPDWLRDGDNRIRIVRRSGNGPIYFAVEATYFSFEDPIPAAGSELFVRRKYYRLAPYDTLLSGTRYERLPLEDGGAVRSGERVEVVLTVEAKNDHEYLVFEDLKPAGLEAVDVRSGQPQYARRVRSNAVDRDPTSRQRQDLTADSRWVYQELRDRKIALFIDRLPQGVWEIRYELRAEVPGRFHALPVLGHAMYVPEIRANSDEIRLDVLD